MPKNVKTEGEKIWGKNFRKATSAACRGFKRGCRGLKIVTFLPDFLTICYFSAVIRHNIGYFVTFSAGKVTICKQVPGATFFPILLFCKDSLFFYTLLTTFFVSTFFTLCIFIRFLTVIFMQNWRFWGVFGQKSISGIAFLFIGCILRKFNEYLSRSVNIRLVSLNILTKNRVYEFSLQRNWGATIAKMRFFHYLCGRKVKEGRCSTAPDRLHKTLTIMSTKKTSQQLTAEKRIETGTDLSDAQVINAYLQNHAVEHYCAALNESEELTEEKLKQCEKETGIYWLYTCPTLGGKKTDGTPYPTKEEWMKANPAAVEVRTIMGKTWFKRPFIIGDARGVRSVVAGLDNYLTAKESMKEREAAQFEKTASILAGKSKEEQQAIIARLLAAAGIEK